MTCDLKVKHLVASSKVAGKVSECLCWRLGCSKCPHFLGSNNSANTKCPHYCRCPRFRGSRPTYASTSTSKAQQMAHGEVVSTEATSFALIPESTSTRDRERFSNFFCWGKIRLAIRDWLYQAHAPTVCTTAPWSWPGVNQNKLKYIILCALRHTLVLLI